jgi:hypothetical protein
VIGIIAKAGDFVKRRRELVWRGFVLALIAWSAYNLGVIGARHGATPAQEATLLQPRAAIVSQTPIATKQGSVKPTVDHSDPRVVASKTSSSKKYHYSWCSSGQRIKPANQLWFPSEAAAQAAGYSLAGTCTP